MNQNPTSRWSPMVSAPDDDFANFLDFGDLSFPTFGDGSGGQSQGVGGNLQQDGGATAMDTSVEGPSTAGILGSDMQQLEEPGQLPDMNGFQEAFSDLDAATDFLNHQQHQPHPQNVMHMQQPRFYSHNTVPPTPNSLEMHGKQADFYQNHAERQQQIFYEHYRRQQNEQMNFTPLVSPAVTPLDTQFQNPDFIASADSFSPLTSPALRAQTHNVHQSMYGGVRGSDTSDTTTSPIDPSLDFSGHTHGSTPAPVRKSKRTASSGSTKNPARAVRQSPVVKPQSRRKQPSSTVIPPKEVAGILEEAISAKKITSAGRDGKLPLPYTQDSSGPDSVSPEPLSEILMPPPATPKSNSAGRSPYLAGKQGDPQQASPGLPAKEAPATPASLMKIRKQASKQSGRSRATSSLKEQAVMADAEMEQIMEDISLPEAATSSKKPALRPINTEGANNEKSIPRSSANKTPTAASAPVTATGSAFPSPTASAVASPNGIPNGKTSEQPKLKIRDSKKRNSTSNQISPALRPKISPSIKPLLPEGVVSAETSALLLASKSNYQNILEGTHLPGVSYPETLSTNLTSKRTSHKIAEQGRRNRINTALQEIASLLPPQTPPINGQSPTASQAGLMMTTGSAAQQNNSKASTVEMAIDYIKTLQGELKSVKDRLREVESQQTPSKPNDLKDDVKADEPSDVEVAPS